MGSSSDHDAPLTACPLCSGGPLYHRLTDYRGNGIDACRACGVEFMNPQYSDESLRALYADYTHLNGHHDETRHRQRFDVRQTGKRRSIELLQKYAPGPRILMVGCGDGLELREAKACGLQPEGYDVHPATTAAVAAAEGVRVHCGDFHELPAHTAPFDAVFLDQVIEHPKDPGRCLETCRALLRPGGVVFLGVPNLGSITNRLKTLADRLRLRSRPGRHYNTRHHITFFRPAVLVRHLRERLGMDVLRVRASLKPQRNPLSTLINGVHPVFDSSFFVIARVPSHPAADAVRHGVRATPPEAKVVGGIAVASVQAGTAPARRVT